MSSPLVSVVMPTFNRQALLQLAVESVLNQTIDDFELLVVDDASTDGTAAWVSKKATSDKRIRLLRLDVNRGCNAARNLAIGQARGCYVAFLDDDDLFLPDRLEQAIAKFEAIPQLGVVFSHFGFVDAKGDKLSWTPKFLPIGENATPGNVVFAMLYCDWGWIPTCTLTVRAELLATLGYLEFRKRDNDAIFNAQLAASGALFAQIPRRLALVRRGTSHAFMSQDRKALLEDRRTSLSILRSWLAERNITCFNTLHGRAWSNQLINEAEFLGGLPGFWRAIRSIWHWPKNPRAAQYLWRRILVRRDR